MADDPTGRPKPTARRRRGTVSNGSASASGAAETIDPAPVGLDATPVEPPVVDDIEAVERTDETAAEAEPNASSTTAWPMLDGRSSNEWVCPFLRSADDQDRLDLPIEAPDAANRCAALEEVVPQSLRQQELVCLTTSHVNCPRYLRGAVAAVDPTEARVRAIPTMTPAMVGALALLAAAFAASVAFTLARGGLDLPAAAGQGSARPSSSGIAAVPTAAPSAVMSLPPGNEPTASIEPSLAPAPTPSPTGTLEASPSVAPTASAPASPAPSSDRYALLTACPDKPDCWLYRIRSGDNLFSIARYFGVPLGTVTSLNPWTSSVLKVGRDLILPPPTR